MCTALETVFDYYIQVETISISNYIKFLEGLFAFIQLFGSKAVWTQTTIVLEMASIRLLL